MHFIDFFMLFIDKFKILFSFEMSNKTKWSSTSFK